jgi:hypothetical protein
LGPFAVSVGKIRVTEQPLNDRRRSPALEQLRREKVVQVVKAPAVALSSGLSALQRLAPFYDGNDHE